MAETRLTAFSVKVKVYFHTINHNNDATYLRNSFGDCVYSVTSDATLYEGDFENGGKCIGRFKLQGGRWYYESTDELHLVHATPPSNDLLATEVVVFKHYLG